MKGIVLAGGTGSRLSPLTAVTNKHLLPVGSYPMVFHPIACLKQASIKDILVVTSRDHMGDVTELLGSGRDFGLDFTYKVQDQAGGIAQALGLARSFCCGDTVVTTGGGGTRECAVDNATVLVSPPRNPTALSSNLVRVSDSDVLRLRMAHAGHDYVQQFSLPTTTQRLLSYLQELRSQTRLATC